ncbi:hypothetical protein Tco_1380683 [Tanacetum coccineum]
MLSHPEIQGQRKRSIQAPLKTPPNLNISLSASLLMQKSQVILLKTQTCNKIKSSSRETMMNNPLTRRLPRLIGSRNPSDLQLLILIRVRDNKLTSDLLRPRLVKLNIKDLTQEILIGPAFNLLKGTYKSLIELEYHLEECSNATTERLDWHNPEGKPRRFKQTVLNSVIKTKAATYDLKWIKDLVPKLWSPVQKYDYGHLEEIEVRRDDQKLYKFREGDFQRLCLQDIEDMLLLLVQQKLTNLTIDEWYDLNVALRMFTRRIVIQRRVKDLQLGVESYQKKLNLTKPYTFRPNLRNRTTYTACSDPKGMIYKEQNNRNRLMRADEIHKFSDGTLNDVRTALHDIAKGIRMEYPPKRKWSSLDKRRARVMI